MRLSQNQSLDNANIHIQGLKQRPELESLMPYRLDVLEPLYGKALKLKSANPRLVKAARAATSAISDVAYELRGILNANVAFAVSVVGPRAVVLKDLGGKPSKSRSRIGRDVTEAPKAASIPGNDTESPTVGPAATKDVA